MGISLGSRCKIWAIVKINDIRNIMLMDAHMLVIRFKRIRRDANDKEKQHQTQNKCKFNKTHFYNFLLPNATYCYLSK